MSQTNLLGHLKTYGNPLIDDDLATFVWLGDTHPHLIGEFNNWGRQPNGERASAPMTEVEKGVWVHPTRLPRDAYIEYYWAVDLTDDKKRAPDPHNPRKITNGIGDFNHYFAMPDWKPTPLTRVKKGVPRGKITHFDIKQVAPDFYLPKRDVWLYAPPDITSCHVFSPPPDPINNKLLFATKRGLNVVSGLPLSKSVWRGG